MGGSKKSSSKNVSKKTEKKTPNKDTKQRKARAGTVSARKILKSTQYKQNKLLTKASITRKAREAFSGEGNIRLSHDAVDYMANCLRLSLLKELKQIRQIMPVNRKFVDIKSYQAKAFTQVEPTDSEKAKLAKRKGKNTYVVVEIPVTLQEKHINNFQRLSATL